MNHQKGFANIVIISVIAVIVIVGGYFALNKKPPLPPEQPVSPVTSDQLIQPTQPVSQSGQPQFLFPKGGEKLELGDTYEIRLKNYSSNKPMMLSRHIFSQDGQDMGEYSTITTLSTSSEGVYRWTIPTSYRLSQKYKIALFSLNPRVVIAESDGFFTIKDDIPLIIGAESIIINPNHLFSFGVPFTITGVTGFKPAEITSPAIYSSASKVQLGLVTARIYSLHADACEVMTWPDSSPPRCDVKGEPAARIEIRAVISDQGQHYVIGRSAYLTPTKEKVQRVGDLGSQQYDVELLSMDLQKQQATIVIRKVSINPAPSQMQTLPLVQ